MASKVARSSRPSSSENARSPPAIGRAKANTAVAAAGIDAAEVARRVDPDLVAGLRVLTGRGLVDASAKGLAAQAERVLVNRLDRENSDHG